MSMDMLPYAMSYNQSYSPHPYQHHSPSVPAYDYEPREYAAASGYDSGCGCGCDSGGGGGGFGKDLLPILLSLGTLGLLIFYILMQAMAAAMTPPPAAPPPMMGGRRKRDVLQEKVQRNDIFQAIDELRTKFENGEGHHGLRLKEKFRIQSQNQLQKKNGYGGMMEGPGGGFSVGDIQNQCRLLLWRCLSGVAENAVQMDANHLSKYLIGVILRAGLKPDTMILDVPLVKKSLHCIKTFHACPMESAMPINY